MYLTGEDYRRVDELGERLDIDRMLDSDSKAFFDTLDAILRALVACKQTDELLDLQAQTEEICVQCENATNAGTPLASDALELASEIYVLVSDILIKNVNRALIEAAFSALQKMKHTRSERVQVAATFSVPTHYVGLDGTAAMFDAMHADLAEVRVFDNTTYFLDSIIVGANQDEERGTICLMATGWV